MEQFNPSLRNFIAMGKNYEKALAGEAAGRGQWPPCGWAGHGARREAEGDALFQKQNLPEGGCGAAP